MAKKIIQMYDKYQSTTKVYPKVLEECLPEDVQEKLNKEGVPTITIDVSQFLRTDQVQLTDEQYEILTNNAFVNVVLPTGENIGFNILKNETAIILSNCIGSATEITYFKGYVDKETKIVILSNSDFSGGKQLYQHNIKLKASRSSYNAWVGINIINDSSIPFTRESIISYLASKGFTSNALLYTNISGIVYIGQIYILIGTYVNDNKLYLYGTNDGASTASQNFEYNYIDDTAFADTIITL